MDSHVFSVLVIILGCALCVYAKGQVKMHIMADNQEVPRVRGIANVKRGSSIRIQCVIVEPLPGHHSNHLELVFRDKKDKKIKENRLNNSTLEVIIEGLTQSCEFICKYNKINMDLVEVRVGKAPTKLISFTCRAIEWQYMECSLKAEENVIQTTRKVFYNAISRTGECKFVRTNPDVCVISEDQYPSVYPKIDFTVEQHNVLGSYSEHIEIQNFGTVVPKQVTKLIASNVTTSSAHISWKIPATFELLPEDYTFKVSYKSQYDDQWILYSHVNTTEVDLDNLLYGNANYQVRVDYKVAIANDIPEMWSPSSQLEFQTLPRLPERAPITDPSAFYIDENNALAVYYKPLDAPLIHSPWIDYNFIGHITNGSNLPPRQIHRISTIFFCDLDLLQDDQNINIIISSRNSVGQSAPVHITILSERISKPRFLKKILFPANSTHISKYRISWCAPVHDDRYTITSYTVSWCVPRSENSNDCQSDWDFTHVNANRTWFEMNSNRTHNFAVSANSDNSSSGMVWSQCTSTAGSDLRKLQVGLESRSVHWIPNCGDEGLLDGFILKFCKVPCEEGDVQHIRLNDSNQRRYHLPMSPEEEYRIEVAGISLYNGEIGPFVAKYKTAEYTSYSSVYVLITIILITVAAILIYTISIYVIPTVNSMKNIDVLMPESLHDPVENKSNSNTLRSNIIPLMSSQLVQLEHVLNSNEMDQDAVSRDTNNSFYTETKEKNNNKNLPEIIICTKDKEFVIHRDGYEPHDIDDTSKVDGSATPTVNPSTTTLHGYVPMRNIWPEIQGYVTQKQLSMVDPSQIDM